VFHYLPLCFAGSWIMMLTCLLRGSKLTLNTDLGKIAAEMRLAAPDYFLNVPALLERMRKAIDEQLWKTGGFPLKVYTKAKGASVRRQEGKSRAVDRLWLGLANGLVFPTIRKRMIGGKLRALICGSAPLGVETQLFFMMLGIPVLQVYGLTETTAICTMDNPNAAVVPGRAGEAIARGGDEDRRQRRDRGARAEYFSGILESSGRNSEGAARRLVSYWAIRAKWMRTETGRSSDESRT
jgi:long-chain acyl-CoA synthetase